jgi:hypothetical protein
MKLFYLLYPFYLFYRREAPFIASARSAAATFISAKRPCKGMNVFGPHKIYMLNNC